MVEILFKFVDLKAAAGDIEAQTMLMPKRGSALAAGLDLVAANEIPITLEPLARALVPTGVSMALPAHYEGQVRPRSGLALKNGITVLNSPGTIDADYRGEICVVLINLGSHTFVVERGMRIAQLVIAKVAEISPVTAVVLTSTDRGAGGFGSTGQGTSC